MFIPSTSILASIRPGLLSMRRETRWRKAGGVPPGTAREAHLDVHRPEVSSPGGVAMARARRVLRGLRLRNEELDRILGLGELLRDETCKGLRQALLSGILWEVWPRVDKALPPEWFKPGDVFISTVIIGEDGSRGVLWVWPNTERDDFFPMAVLVEWREFIEEQGITGARDLDEAINRLAQRVAVSWMKRVQNAVKPESYGDASTTD